jgi:DNA polymerase I-like protein with 3'-5' exonuclease and polymerase domains
MSLQMAMFASKTEWVPPLELPDITGASKIAIDVETRDPNLKTNGPGWPTGDGEIVGYALAVDGWSGYLPVRHLGGGNLDERIVNRWLKKVFECPADKIMHNAQYDLGWIKKTGFTVNGRIIDTMIVASLLDENRFSYSLNALCYDLLSKTKSEKGLVAAALEFGVDPKAEMWKLPAMYVGPYAEADAELTLELWSYFSVKLRQEDLWGVANLELDLLPCLVDMTMRGVRVDVNRVERTRNSLLKREGEVLKELKHVAGAGVEIWAAQSLAKSFDKLGIHYPKTEKGSPSFTKLFLQEHSHPVAKLIVEARNLNKTSGTFINSIMKHCRADGRIHSHINQLRSDDGGTVSGRLCVHGDTLLELNTGPVKIKDYHPTGHERIKTHTGDWCRVVRRYDKGVEEMVRLTTSDGSSATCTGGHRVLSPEGWVTVGHLKVGDLIYHVSQQNSLEGRGSYEQPHRQLGVSHALGAPDFAQLVAVAEIKPVGKARVWDIEVEGDHSYLAGGLIHHNSYNSPNLQQIPARDPIYGPMIRSLFLPEEGEQWAAIDFSQQEPRILVHYAHVYGKTRGIALEGAADFVHAYNDKPETDFHSLVAEMANIPRKQAKGINLGLIYGMGVPKMSEQLDISVEEARALVKQYHERVPFVKALMTGVMNRLNDKSSGGALRSLEGRKCRFDTWEPDTFAMNKALPYKEAVEAYGPTTRLKRAYTYKALNRLIQASAADMTKKAMVHLYKLGHLPLLQMHDELDMSVKTIEEAWEIAKIMEAAVPLEVPNVCDVEIGPSWGEAKQVTER